MNRAKYTPGPWHAVAGMVEVEDDKAPDVCACNPQLFGQGYLPTTTEREYANARLIAAAPDMLKALQRLTRPIPDDENMGHALDDIQNALEVIARATGESK